MKSPVTVTVTGAAGQICYSLLFRVASGAMFGPDRPVNLRLLEVPVEAVMNSLKGVAMELDDCAFPLLNSVTLHDDPKTGFAGTNWALLVGAKPRGKGMERADLLKDNGKIFVAQGKIIDEVAADDCRVVVVGNPANANCMIAASQAKRLPADRFTAMVRLDQNRAATQLAKKANVGVSDVTDIFIYGNHSPTMFADYTHAKIKGRPASEVIGDHAWLSDEFLKTVGQRGATVIAARGASSAASAANALVDHVRDLNTVGKVHSVAVCSDGSYGFTPGVWAGVPVRTTAPGAFEVIKSYDMSDFAKGRIKITNDELVSERDTIAKG